MNADFNPGFQTLQYFPFCTPPVGRACPGHGGISNPAKADLMNMDARTNDHRTYVVWRLVS